MESEVAGGKVERMSGADIIELDVIGENCPMPLLKAKRALNAMQKGQHLKVLATDRGSIRDFQVFAQQSGNVLLSSREEDGVYIHLLMKS
jgi:tRNA 2-thiouridine synthesizing protein A